MTLAILAQISSTIGGISVLLAAVVWAFKYAIRQHELNELLENSRTVEKRSRELEHNGGSSIKDAIVRIEKRLVAVEGKVGIDPGDYTPRP